MKKRFLPLIAMMASFAVFGCSDTKVTTNEKSPEPAAKPVAELAPENTAHAVVEGTKTIKLANGASVTWIQDNQGEKLNPRSLFSDVSDSLFASLNLPVGEESSNVARSSEMFPIESFVSTSTFVLVMLLTRASSSLESNGFAR